MSGVKGMRRGRGLPDGELEPCGTLAAYRRHLRRGDPVDRDCRQAVVRDWQDRAAAGQERRYRGVRAHAANRAGRAACGDPREVTVTPDADLVTCLKCRTAA